MVRAVADKTGRMCIYNLPLLVLFAGRNNALIWGEHHNSFSAAKRGADLTCSPATGIPFATFNLFVRELLQLPYVPHSDIHSLSTA